MEVVAGLTLKNVRPRVWDPGSVEFLPALRAVMLSFDEFRQFARRRDLAARDGWRAVLPGAPAGLRLYLDNGAFACLRRGDAPDAEGFRAFVAAVRPHWHPVAADFIPLPTYSRRRQRTLFERTVAVLRVEAGNGACPVVHPGPWLDGYLEEVTRLGYTAKLAIGGLVPHLLNSPGAARRATIQKLKQIRRQFPGRLHAFGIGGLVTLHVATALGIDSVDSSGWRQRAARGLVLLRGRGERQAVKLGKWLGRAITHDEWDELDRCRCPACRRRGAAGLRAERIDGFAHRAVHNLALLLDEAALIGRHRVAGDLAAWSSQRMRDNRMADLVAAAWEEET